MYQRKAEWDKQESVWLCYPSHDHHWGVNLPSIKKFVIKLIGLISQYQKVDLLVNDRLDLKMLKAEFEGSKFLVQCHHLAHNDIWIRDYGPIFLNSKSQLKISKFGFNAWGGKFPPYELDNRVSFEIA